MSLSLFLVADSADLRQARVVSTSDLSFNPLPRLQGGDRIPVGITLLNADGTVHALSGDSTLIPRLALGLRGHEALVEVDTFVAVASAPKGWTCILDLDSDALLLVLRSAVGLDLTLSFRTTTAAGARTTWTALDCSVEDYDPAAASASTTSAITTPELRSDLTSAALHRAVVTAGHALPWMVYTLEADTWLSWTLRARTGADPDDAALSTTYGDGALYRLPADASAVSNNVLWVRSPVA